MRFWTLFICALLILFLLIVGNQRASGQMVDGVRRTATNPGIEQTQKMLRLPSDNSLFVVQIGIWNRLTGGNSIRSGGELMDSSDERERGGLLRRLIEARRSRRLGGGR